MSKKTDPDIERLTKVYLASQTVSSGVKTESSTLEDSDKTAHVKEDVVDDPLRRFRSGSQHFRVSNDHSPPFY